MRKRTFDDDRSGRINESTVVMINPKCYGETPLQAVFMPPKCCEQTWKRKNKNSRF